MTALPSTVGTGGDVVNLPLDRLWFSPCIRAGGLNKGHIRVMAELGGLWPPILVTAADYRVIDGAHRVAAARRLGLGHIPAVLFDGDDEQEFLEFVRANVSHGLPLSLAERRSAARRILGWHPRWSDRRVGEVCALSTDAVARVRSELTAAIGNDGCPTDGHPRFDGRIGRDGRIRPVDPGASRERIAQALTSTPQASLREIAAAVGASPETVRTVRANMLVETGDGQGPVFDGTIGDPGCESQEPTPKPWCDDAALMSRSDGAEFVRWFEQTAVDEDQCAQRIGTVPVSRVYEVADEARRRAACWASFATEIERRSKARAKSFSSR